MSSSKHGAESAVATHPTADAIEARAQPSLLFAANGSPDADVAFRFASALARRDDLLLRVLTVLEPLPAIPSHQAGVGWHSAIETELGEQILNRVRSELAKQENPPSALMCMLVGGAGATIAQAALQWNAKYVVVGPGRHSALERFLTGDTVVRVVRHSASPVIAVPASGGILPSNGVAALDFGKASLAAAHSAAQLIGEGVLHLLHVRPEIDLPATDPSAWSEVYESGSQSLLTKIADELKESAPGVRTTTTLLRGHVSTVLLDYADTVDADLIAVGQHGYGVVDRFLFGTVAQTVLCAAPSAVLVAPPDDRGS